MESASRPLGVLPDFPERLRIELDGVPLESLPESILEHYHPKRVRIEIFPFRPRFLAENRFIVKAVSDWAHNRQDFERELEFPASEVGLSIEVEE